MPKRCDLQFPQMTSGKIMFADKVFESCLMGLNVVCDVVLKQKKSD